MVGSGMVLTLCGERRPACVSLSQRRYSFHVPLTLTPSDSGRRLEKLSAQDPKVHTCMYGKVRVAWLNTCTSKINHLLLYPLLKPLVPGSLIPIAGSSPVSLIPIAGSSQGASSPSQAPPREPGNEAKSLNRKLIFSFTTYLWDHYWSVWKYQWIYPFLVFNDIVGLKKMTTRIDHLPFLKVRGRHVNL
jgi:hypothetical protein